MSMLIAREDGGTETYDLPPLGRVEITIGYENPEDAITFVSDDLQDGTLTLRYNHALLNGDVEFVRTQTRKHRAADTFITQRATHYTDRRHRWNNHTQTTDETVRERARKARPEYRRLKEGYHRLRSVLEGRKQELRPLRKAASGEHFDAVRALAHAQSRLYDPLERLHNDVAYIHDCLNVIVANADR